MNETIKSRLFIQIKYNLYRVTGKNKLHSEFSGMPLLVRICNPYLSRKAENKNQKQYWQKRQEKFLFVFAKQSTDYKSARAKGKQWHKLQICASKGFLTELMQFYYF